MFRDMGHNTPDHRATVPLHNTYARKDFALVNTLPCHFLRKQLDRFEGRSFSIIWIELGVDPERRIHTGAVVLHEEAGAVNDLPNLVALDKARRDGGRHVFPVGLAIWVTRP